MTGFSRKPVAGAVKVSYGYAPDGLLLSRTPGGGHVEHVTWNRLAGISRMLALADTEFVYGLGQAPIVQTTPGKADSGGLVWLHTDRLGSVVATTDTTGGVSSASGWGVYGGETSAAGSGKRVSSVSVFGFAGEYTDPLSGLVFLRARWLAPPCGWFLSVDPLVAVSGEPYLYAAGSPTVLTDPTGLLPGLSAPPVFGANRVVQWLSSQAVQLSQNETLRSVMDHTAHQSAVVAVNFGRSATGGLTDKVANWISPGASCIVEHDSASARAAQGLGMVGGALIPVAPAAASVALARDVAAVSKAAANSKLGRAVAESIRYGDDTGAVSLSDDVNMQRMRHYTSLSRAKMIKAECDKCRYGALRKYGTDYVYAVPATKDFSFNRVHPLDNLDPRSKPNAYIDFDVPPGTFRVNKDPNPRVKVDEWISGAWDPELSRFDGKPGSDGVRIYNVEVNRIH